MSEPTTARAAPTAAGIAARHALGWLVAANAVGVGLAALLLWPDLNDALGPLTYGRWVPLHLDWQLYGGCALPLVAVLLQWCLGERPPSGVAQARVAVGLWSLALLLGGVAWLGGGSSGKMFLEWHGWTRPLLPLAMVVLWAVLASHAWRRRGAPDRSGHAGRAAVLLVLLAVPGVLYWSAGRGVYPSVNPDSGGATGTRLLLSTLGIVVIFGLLAEILGLARRRSGPWFWGYAGFSALVGAAIEHGNASHHEAAEILGLATLLGWIPLAWFHFTGGQGVAAARRWWAAAYAWWVLLVVLGLLNFLPGFSERLKFTNAMVGHAHLAMAGLVTSANLAVLQELGAGRRFRRFWLWQIACAVQIAALAFLGWGELGHGAELFYSAPWTQAIYGLRLVAGLGMLGASVAWWCDARGATNEGVAT